MGDTAPVILVVDDNETKRVALRAMLKSLGFPIVEADSGRAALLFLLHQTAAIILMDVRMPTLDGYETARLIRQRSQTGLTPIIFVTAYAREDLAVTAAYATGGVDFIFAPVEPDILRAKVSTFTDLFLKTQALERSIESITELNRAPRESEARSHAVSQHVGESILTVGESGRKVPSRDSTRTGHRAEELIGTYLLNDTGQHTRRVGEMSVAIARALGLPDTEVELLRFAASLHDLGKVAIPDNVLGKAGGLTHDEFEQMKAHTTVGGTLLAGGGNRLLEMAERIALTHHEKWDGSGYPAGLAGEEIPITGRIVAVADVFDALTHTRPYKPAWSADAAIMEMTSHPGKHFDPEVLTAFLKVLPDLLADGELRELGPGIPVSIIRASQS